MNTLDAELQSLIRATLDGTATSAQSERLAALLHREPTLRREYVRQMRLDAALRFAHGAAPRTVAVPQRKVVHFPLARLSWAAAAAAVLAAGLFLLFGMSRGVQVQVVSAGDGAPPEFVAGRTLRLDLLKMIRGNVRMRLPSGVLLDVVAPIEMRLLNAMHLNVLSGRITADVGEDAKGFVIETPQTRIVDLGTRFGVDASGAAHTDVIVFQGRVELYKPAKNERVALLNAGDAVRVSDIKRLSRIVSITGDGAGNGWSASSTQPTGALISAVKDNLSGDYPSLHNFYRIVPGSLREGLHAYADAADEWRNIPPALEGADVVQTFHADNLNWWLQVTLNIEHPVILYVFADERNPVPPWLARDFTATNETLTLAVISATDPRGTETLTFSVWKREVREAGVVTLGAPYFDPPADRKTFRPSRMYGIAAQPLEP